MTETKQLAEAIADLIPERVAPHIERLLDSDEKLYTYALAFECHKALVDKFEEHYSSDFDVKAYGYGCRYDCINHFDVLGKGVTHEVAIFNAVLDWNKKGYK